MLQFFLFSTKGLETPASTTALAAITSTDINLALTASLKAVNDLNELIQIVHRLNQEICKALHIGAAR